jgi:hypothetical protein
LIAAGRRSFLQLTDSIRRTTDDRAELARESLDSFRFDSTSFGLSDIARAPAVAFMVPGNGSDGEALALNLPPVAAEAPIWWRAVHPTLPTWAADSSRVRWTRPGYDVVARPTDEGESLAITLVPMPARAVAEWPIATVPAPAYQLIPLDAPAVSTTLREALSRAFDASTTLDGIATSAARHRLAPRSPRVTARRVRQATSRPFTEFRRAIFRTVSHD